MLRFKEYYWDVWTSEYEPQYEDGYGFAVFSNLDMVNPLLADYVCSEEPVLDRSIHFHMNYADTLPEEVLDQEKAKIRTAWGDGIALQWLLDNPEEAWPEIRVKGMHGEDCSFEPHMSVLCFKETVQKTKGTYDRRYPLAILYKDQDGKFVVRTDIFEEA